MLLTLYSPVTPRSVTRYGGATASAGRCCLRTGALAAPLFGDPRPSPVPVPLAALKAVSDHLFGPRGKPRTDVAKVLNVVRGRHAFLA